MRLRKAKVDQDLRRRLERELAILTDQPKTDAFSKGVHYACERIYDAVGTKNIHTKARQHSLTTRKTGEEE